MDYDLSTAFRRIEDELISSMMRNLSRHRAEETAEGFQWSQWQTEQLAALSDYNKQGSSKFSKRYFSTLNGKISDALRDSYSSGETTQEAAILRAIQSGSSARQQTGTLGGSFFRTNERKLNALVKATTDDMAQAETAVLRRANDAYRKIIYDAQVYANTGAGTYEKAVDMATKDFLAAGIQCVEYSNGARHTLSDYADMAIKTASKRAYLQGEGDKRQEWGISTVIVNKRGNACPKCARFCGKVFIDDVWSGGKRSDGNYPLLSAAIAQGLYHPRCKDSHSTWFPELHQDTTPYTKEEIAELEGKEQAEQRQQYAQRQAEKYRRMEKYSLDPDNQRKYGNLAEQWEKEVAKTSEPDILDILNDTDMRAIQDYMSSGVAYSLNDALRTGRELTEEQKAIVQNLDAALAKLPDYKGTVYRSVSTSMMDDPAAFLEEYQVGALVRFPAYTSTGKTVYDPSMEIQFVITSKHGKDISSINKNEQEVLFQRESYFRVTHRDGYKIQMEEV